jgi:hypothetical protein
MTEKASEIVTASGSPSGTATTMTVTAMMMKSMNLFRVSTVANYLVSSR